jgi:hypothetical protein
VNNQSFTFVVVVMVVVVLVVVVTVVFVIFPGARLGSFRSTASLLASARFARTKVVSISAFDSPTGA